jgi:hypothetical protein
MSYLSLSNKYLKRSTRIVFLTLLLVSLWLTSYSQEPPPRPLVVTVTRNISFGAFTHGLTGGSVSLDVGGTRTKTGDVILLNLGYTYSTATYSLVANPGTVVSLLPGSDVYLNGSNGGTLRFHIDSTNPASPFVISTIPPASTTLYLGGTLTVGNTSSNPPGNYSGTFNLTFIQE